MEFLQQLEFFPKTVLATSKKHTGIIWKTVFDKRHQIYFASAGQDSIIRIWDSTSSNLTKDDSKEPCIPLVTEFQLGHSSDVYDLVISHDNKILVSVGKDKQCAIWDISSGRCLRRFRAHEQSVNCCQFNSSSSILFTGGVDKYVKIWDMRINKRYPLIQMIKDPTDSIGCLYVPQDENASSSFSVGSLDGQVYKYDIRKGMVTVDFFGHPVTHLDVSKNEKITSVSLTCAKQPSSILAMDALNGTLLKRLTGHKNKLFPNSSMLIKPWQSIQCSSSECGNLFFWDLASQQTRKLSISTSPISTFDFHPGKPKYMMTGNILDDSKGLLDNQPRVVFKSRNSKQPLIKTPKTILSDQHSPALVVGDSEGFLYLLRTRPEQQNEDETFSIPFTKPDSVKDTFLKKTPESKSIDTNSNKNVKNTSQSTPLVSFPLFISTRHVRPRSESLSPSEFLFGSGPNPG